MASAGDIAIYFREDCRPLRDSLQLEMVVAQYWLRIRDVVTTAGMPVGHIVAAGVVAELEREGDPLSCAILRGLARLAPGPTGRRAAESAACLSASAVEPPEQFADVGDARPVGAWRARDATEDDYALFAEFEHARGGRHVLALFVIPEGGGTVKHIGLLGPMSTIDLNTSFRPGAVECLALPTAAELMRTTLTRTYGPLLERTDDYRVLVAAARAAGV